MALDPHNEHTDVSLHGDHPQERPEDWGWHAEWGGVSRVAGWIVAVVLVLMILPAHYNGQGTLFLGLSAAGLVVLLMWDRQRRKNAWRQ